MKVSHGSAISLAKFLNSRLRVRPGRGVSIRAGSNGPHLTNTPGALAWRDGSAIVHPGRALPRFAASTGRAAKRCRRARAVNEPGATAGDSNW
jgi:hypothetical protein